MNRAELTDRYSRHPMEPSHEAMHNTIDAQIAEYERLGGAIE